MFEEKRRCLNCGRYLFFEELPNGGIVCSIDCKNQQLYQEKGIIKYNVVNCINSDGDFWYSSQRSSSYLADSREEAFEYITKIMKSLETTIEAKSNNLETRIKKDINIWLESCKKGKLEIPDFDYGNQSITFNIEKVLVIGKERKLIEN